MQNKYRAKTPVYKMPDKNFLNSREFILIVKRLYDIEFLEISNNILNLTKKEFFENISSRLKNILSELYSNEMIENEKKLFSLLNTYEKQYELKYNNYLLELNIFIQKHKQDQVNGIKEKYITNFRKHCSKTDNYAIHNCNQKNQQGYFLPIYEQEKLKYVICKECNKTFLGSKFINYCKHCNLDYYSNILDENQNQDLMPAAWKNFHCKFTINQKINCPNCNDEFYIDTKYNILKCLKCKNYRSPKNIENTCNICRKKYSSEVVIYNPLEKDYLNDILNNSIISKNRARPEKISCCKNLNINTTKFYHSNNCKGILYFIKFNNKLLIGCEKCKQFYFYNSNFIWTCPSCGRQFKEEEKIEQKEKAFLPRNTDIELLKKNYLDEKFNKFVKKKEKSESNVIIYSKNNLNNEIITNNGNNNIINKNEPEFDIIVARKNRKELSAQFRSNHLIDENDKKECTPVQKGRKNVISNKNSVINDKYTPNKNSINNDINNGKNFSAIYVDKRKHKMSNKNLNLVETTNIKNNDINNLKRKCLNNFSNNRRNSEYELNEQSHILIKSNELEEKLNNYRSLGHESKNDSTNDTYLKKLMTKRSEDFEKNQENSKNSNNYFIVNSSRNGVIIYDENKNNYFVDINKKIESKDSNIKLNKYNNTTSNFNKNNNLYNNITNNLNKNNNVYKSITSNLNKNNNLYNNTTNNLNKNNNLYNNTTINFNRNNNLYNNTTNNLIKNNNVYNNTTNNFNKNNNVYNNNANNFIKNNNVYNNTSNLKIDMTSKSGNFNNSCKNIKINNNRVINYNNNNYYNYINNKIITNNNNNNRRVNNFSNIINITKNNSNNNSNNSTNSNILKMNYYNKYNNLLNNYNKDSKDYNNNKIKNKNINNISNSNQNNNKILKINPNNNLNINNNIKNENNNKIQYSKYSQNPKNVYENQYKNMVDNNNLSQRRQQPIRVVSKKENLYNQNISSSKYKKRNELNHMNIDAHKEEEKNQISKNNDNNRIKVNKIFINKEKEKIIKKEEKPRIISNQKEKEVKKEENSKNIPFIRDNNNLIKEEEKPKNIIYPKKYESMNNVLKIEIDLNQPQQKNNENKVSENNAFQNRFKNYQLYKNKRKESKSPNKEKKEQKIEEKKEETKEDLIEKEEKEKLLKQIELAKSELEKNKPDDIIAPNNIDFKKDLPIEDPYLISHPDLLDKMQKDIKRIIYKSHLPLFDPNCYNIEKKIGEGTYGAIFEVINTKTKKKYAMKKIITNNVISLKYLKSEFEITYENIHPHILNIYGIHIKCFDSNTFSLCVLMDLAETDWDMEIAERLKNKKNYTEEELIFILKQLESALLFLQRDKKIAHRDIKPENVLIFKNNDYRLGDFGEAKGTRFKNKLNTLRGTDIYMSPLLYNGLKASKEDVKHNLYKSDVFSLGYTLLYAISLNYDIINEIRDLEEEDKIKSIIIKRLKPRFSNNFIELILRMINPDENSRIDFIGLDKLIKELL